MLNVIIFIFGHRPFILLPLFFPALSTFTSSSSTFLFSFGLCELGLFALAYIFYFSNVLFQSLYYNVVGSGTCSTVHVCSLPSVTVRPRQDFPRSGYTTAFH